MWGLQNPSLTMASHQNSATSPALMELSSVSQISILNILPTMISMGMPASRLSSITVLSKLSFSVWKWKVICPGESAVSRAGTCGRSPQSPRQPQTPFATGPGHGDEPAPSKVRAGLAALHLQQGDCASCQFVLDRKQMAERLNAHRCYIWLLSLKTPL